MKINLKFWTWPKPWRVWKWPEFLHGKGHDFYDSPEAKELYGKQLINLSEKLFWVMLAPYFGFFLNPEKVELALIMCASTTFFVLGLYMRHQGLRIIDEVKTGKIEIVTNHKHR